MSIDPRYPLPKTRTMCTAFFVFAAIVAIPQVAAAQTVTICHRPPGNPANEHEISVSVNAVPAHLAHGDTIGSCATLCLPPESACGAGQPPCCAGESCTGGVCSAATQSNPLPPGGACNSSAECDPTHPCTFYGPDDGVCGG